MIWVSIKYDTLRTKKQVQIPLVGYSQQQKEILKEIGLKIRDLRLQKGWTQEQLANESEVSLAQIKRIELGTVNASILAIRAIENVLSENI